MSQTYCCGLPPKGSVYLIAIVDIVSCSILTEFLQTLEIFNYLVKDEQAYVKELYIFCITLTCWIQQILGLVSLLLSIVALADVQKVLGPLTPDEEDDGTLLCDSDPATDPISLQSGRDKLSRNLHSLIIYNQMYIFL